MWTTRGRDDTLDASQSLHDKLDCLSARTVEVYLAAW